MDAQECSLKSSGFFNFPHFYSRNCLLCACCAQTPHWNELPPLPIPHLMLLRDVPFTILTLQDLQKLADVITLKLSLPLDNIEWNVACQMLQFLGRSAKVTAEWKAAVSQKVPSPPCVLPSLVLPRGGVGDRHLANPKILLQATVLSWGSVCCEALPLVSPVFSQDILIHFL